MIQLETYEVLKKLRESKGLNKKQVAEQTGLNYTTYCNYESGYRGTDSEALKKLANFYNVSVDYLIGNSTDEQGEMDELLQEIKDRPEMQTLFRMTTRATKEDVEKVIKMMEIFKDTNPDL